MEIFAVTISCQTQAWIVTSTNKRLLHCHIAAMRRLNPLSNWIASLAFALPFTYFQFHCKMVMGKYSKINFFCNFWENFQNNFLIISRKISANAKNNYYFEKFGRIISRNGLQIIKKYFGSFQELFLKISSCFSENFLNYQPSHFEKSRK